MDIKGMVNDILRFGKKPEKEPGVNYFAILTPGHCGSVWLTKMLNCVGDCFCFHEGVYQKVHPLRYYDVTPKHIEEWMDSLLYANHYQRIFRAIGDIGSLNYQTTSLTVLKNNFRLFGLIRDPVLYVRSQLKAFDEFKDGYPEGFRKHMNIFITSAVERFPVLKKYLSDRSSSQFIYSCERYYLYSQALRRDSIRVFRLEDINKKSGLFDALRTITGIDGLPEKDLRSHINEKANTHLSAERIYDPRTIYKKMWTKLERMIFSAQLFGTYRLFYPEAATFFERNKN